MTDYAQLAQNLKDNEAFGKALDSIRSSAVDTLISVNADDKNSIIRAQATVAVVDDIRGNFEQFIRSAAAAQKKPGIA